VPRNAGLWVSAMPKLSSSLLADSRTMRRRTRFRCFAASTSRRRRLAARFDC
jgi:hypothetical protein